MMAVALMSMKYPQFHAEMSTAIDEALDTFAQARAFNPFNIEFLNVIENMAEGYTKLALARPSSSMLERLRAAREKERAELRDEVQEQMRSEAEAEAERAKKKPEKKEAEKEKASAANKKSGAEKGEKEKKQETKPTSTEEEPAEIRSYDTEEGASVVEGTSAEASPYQTRQEWPKERAFWLDSLKRLERLAKRHPCSERLRTTLLEHSLMVADVLGVAKRLNVQLDADNKMDYDVLVDELIRIRTEFFDTQPEMAARLSTKISQIL
jgi:flagellar biosynthesis GTPase FlhF